MSSLDKHSPPSLPFPLQPTPKSLSQISFMAIDQTSDCFLSRSNSLNLSSAASVGIDNPTIEVRFEHLNIEAEAYVGNRGVPTFLNFFSNKAVGILSALHLMPSGKKPILTLHDISGIIKPCRMTLLLGPPRSGKMTLLLALLLGPPGSGKTTLLLALAGRLDEALKVSGNVTYNGHGMNEFVPQRTAAYISQRDVHIS